MAGRTKSGIFIIAPILGPVGERIAALQTTYDPRLLKLGRPHVTLAGSSGMGPVAPDSSVADLEAALAPVAAATPPIPLHFGRATRFMQTEIVVLPLNPHGPLRALHERIKATGLRAAAPRFFFTPHVTLSLYRELARTELGKLLGEKFDEPVLIDRIECYLTRDTGESRQLVTLMLTGEAA